MGISAGFYLSSDLVMYWENAARAILRAEMARRKVSYKVLAARFEAMGEAETEKAIANKIGRGTFSAAFFLKCLSAMQIQRVDVPTVEGQSKDSPA